VNYSKEIQWWVISNQYNWILIIRIIFKIYKLKTILPIQWLSYHICCYFQSQSNNNGSCISLGQNNKKMRKNYLIRHKNIYSTSIECKNQAPVISPKMLLFIWLLIIINPTISNSTKREQWLLHNRLPVLLVVNFELWIPVPVCRTVTERLCNIRGVHIAGRHAHAEIFVHLVWTSSSPTSTVVQILLVQYRIMFVMTPLCTLK
jgi:hypothetical protein